MARFLVRRLVGEDELRGANWEGAIDHLRQAVAGEPCARTHRFELARVDAGQVEEARRELTALMAMGGRVPLDPVVRRQAMELWTERVEATPDPP